MGNMEVLAGAACLAYDVECLLNKPDNIRLIMYTSDIQAAM